jgi:hypothetical protein
MVIESKDGWLARKGLGICDYSRRKEEYGGRRSFHNMTQYVPAEINR